ncbi:MAG: helix-turn-helix domain-containing protein [Rhodospirillaceae bacterium]
MLRRAPAGIEGRLVDFYYHVGEGRGSRTRHQHNGHQISVTVGGTAEIVWWTETHGEARLAPRDGHVLINPAGEPHAAEWHGSWDCVGFYVDPRHTAAVARELGISCDIAPVYDGCDRAVHGLACGLLEEAHTDPLTCRLYAESLADFLALRLLRGAVQKRMPAGALTAAQLRRVTDYIAAHIDRDLSASELAALVDLSPFHFSRRFKASTGMAPYQYVTRRRISAAQELLARTRLTIAEISYRTGFSSQSHLGARFKQIVGVTPRRYREQS